MFLVGSGLYLLCFTRRDDSNHGFVLTVTMAHDEEPQGLAHSQQDETIFLIGMIWVSDEPGVLVEENGLRFLEMHAVLSKIVPSLGAVPFKLQHVIIMA